MNLLPEPHINKHGKMIVLESKSNDVDKFRFRHKCFNKAWNKVWHFAQIWFLLQRSHNLNCLKHNLKVLGGIWFQVIQWCCHFHLIYINENGATLILCLWVHGSTWNHCQAVWKWISILQSHYTLQIPPNNHLKFLKVPRFWRVKKSLKSL